LIGPCKNSLLFTYKWRFLPLRTFFICNWAEKIMEKNFLWTFSFLCLCTMQVFFHNIMILIVPRCQAKNIIQVYPLHSHDNLKSLKSKWYINLSTFTQPLGKIEKMMIFNNNHVCCFWPL